MTQEDILKQQYKAIVENLLIIIDSDDYDEIDFRIWEIENKLKYFHKLKNKLIERTDNNEEF